jgi:hypothetical protein
MKTQVNEIWDGYIERIRQAILEDRFPPYCAKCQPWLRTRTELLLAQIEEGAAPLKQWADMGTSERMLFLARKGNSSMRRYGLREALKRGLQWRRINR